MAIWKLEPVNLNHRDWEASTYRKEVVVRAKSEDDARQIATIAFSIAVTKAPGKTTILNPWSQPALVTAVEVNDLNYSSEGKEEILGPQEALDYCNA